MTHTNILPTSLQTPQHSYTHSVFHHLVRSNFPWLQTRRPDHLADLIGLVVEFAKLNTTKYIRLGRVVRFRLIMVVLFLIMRRSIVLDGQDIRKTDTQVIHFLFVQSSPIVGVFLVDRLVSTISHCLGSISSSPTIRLGPHTRQDGRQKECRNVKELAAQIVERALGRLGWRFFRLVGLELLAVDILVLIDEAVGSSLNGSDGAVVDLHDLFVCVCCCACSVV